MLVGYARVSTQDQNCEMQIEQLQRVGCLHIFSENTSSIGKRPELQKAIASLRAGDVLVVYKLDRLARSLKDLLQIMDRLKRRQAGFKSLTEPIDTTSPIGVMILQILGSVAEFERSLICERSIAGQKNAKDKGKHCGRKPEFSQEQAQRALELRSAGATYAEVFSSTGVGISQQKRLYSGRVLSYGQAVATNKKEAQQPLF